MNITQVMHKLYDRNYLDKLHRSIKEGLVGSLRNEYLMQRPLREPYEKYVAKVNEFVSLPLFHAMVDMMTANLLHSVSKDLVGEVLNTIDELDTLSKPSVPSVTKAEKHVERLVKYVEIPNVEEIEKVIEKTSSFAPVNVLAQAIHNLITKGESK